MRRTRWRELEFEGDWDDLATYNAEKARGIVHTAEMDVAMAAKQARFDRINSQTGVVVDDDEWRREGRLARWLRDWRQNRRRPFVRFDGGERGEGDE